jgi:hypothetical protein
MELISQGHVVSAKFDDGMVDLVETLVELFQELKQKILHRFSH